MAFNRFIELINKNQEIEIFGDGKQTRSFLFVDECVEGIVRLMESNFLKLIVKYLPEEKMISLV